MGAGGLGEGPASRTLRAYEGPPTAVSPLECRCRCRCRVARAGRGRGGRGPRPPGGVRRRRSARGGRARAPRRAASAGGGRGGGAACTHRLDSRILCEFCLTGADQGGGGGGGESPAEVPPGAFAAPGELPDPPPPPSESVGRRRNGAWVYHKGLQGRTRAQPLCPEVFLRRVSAGRKGRRGALRQHTGRASCVRPLPPHRPDFSSSPSALRLNRRQLLQLERSEVCGDAQDVVGHLGHAARHLHVPVPLYRSCRHPRRTPFCSKA